LAGLFFINKSGYIYADVNAVLNLLYEFYLGIVLSNEPQMPFLL
jgi:hypothetical protein